MTKQKVKRNRWQTNKAAFFMAFIGLTAVIATSLAIDRPMIFFLTNITFVLAIIASITGNPFMVTFSVAALSPFIFATAFDLAHVVVLLPITIAVILYWKRASPAGVIVVTGFMIFYGYAVIQAFGVIQIYWFVLWFWPLHLTVSLLLAYIIKTKNKQRSWL